MSYIIHEGGALAWLQTLEADSIQCCVTSPPYWGLRRYVAPDSPAAPLMIGLEETITEHFARLVAVFAEVRRVLRPEESRTGPQERRPLDGLQTPYAARAETERPHPRGRATRACLAGVRLVAQVGNHLAQAYRDA